MIVTSDVQRAVHYEARNLLTLAHSNAPCIASCNFGTDIDVANRRHSRRFAPHAK
jgi:hypothetical protein